ncbi:MAG: DUF1318 domain-containing protein [Deltaproteobacteria bacterium]|nr:DUF1318 domain-containing protein [Deltaproteobacteria bacterium]
MKINLKPICITLMFIILTLFACVTINIYFPAEQVKSVAGEIVDEIRGRESEKTDESFLKKIDPAFFIGVAWAQDVTNVSNPTIRALKERMKKRYAQLKPHYDNGNLKEGDDGYLSIAKTGGLGLKEKRDLTSLVKAENDDRESLYAEVAAALKIDPSQTSKVAEIFAKEWQK